MISTGLAHGDAPRLKSRKPDSTPIGLPMWLRSFSRPSTSSRCVRIAPLCDEANSLNLKCLEHAPPASALSRTEGLTPFQVLAHIVAPQALRVALPPLANNLVALLKDSSLAFAIGVVELTNVGNRVQAATFQPVATLATTACIYLLLTTLLTQASGALENRVRARH